MSIEIIYIIYTTMIQILYNDLLSLIHSYLYFIDKLNHRNACKKFQSFGITDLYNIDPKHSKAFKEINLCKYFDVIQLKLVDNQNIIYLNHITKLKKLILFNSEVGDNGIIALNLEELYASDNQKITTLNHMTKLKKLNIGFNCGVGDNGIIALNLEKLYASDNPKITTLNHMTKLKKLNISGNCGVEDNGIIALNLEELNVYANSKITTLNYVTKLKNSVFE